MIGYALHPEARTDLDQIRDYIAADSIAAADQMIEEILQISEIWSCFLIRGTAAQILLTVLCVLSAFGII